MALPSTVALGHTIRFGVQFHSMDWNAETGSAPSALGAGAGLEVIPAGFPVPKVGLAANDSATGSGPIQFAPVLMNNDLAGTFKTRTNFHGNLQYLIADLFGTETNSNIVSAEPSAPPAAYKHVYTWADSVSNVLNAAWRDRVRGHDIPYMKVMGLTVEFDTAAKLSEFTWDIICKKELVDDTGWNTLASLASVTLRQSQPTTRYMLALASQCRVRFAAQTGGTLESLDASDSYAPNKVTIKIKRAYESYRTILNNPYIDEPVGGAWATVEVDLSFPRDDANTPYAVMAAATAQKMSIDFIGDNMSSEHTASGTATAGGASTISIVSPAYSIADFYRGAIVVITGGTGKGQRRNVSSQAALVLTVDAPWATVPDNTSQYTVSVPYRWLWEFPVAVPKTDGLPKGDKPGIIAYGVHFTCHQAFSNPDSSPAIDTVMPRCTIWDPVASWLA